MCVCIADSLCLQQKLTQHYKPTILQSKFLKNRSYFSDLSDKDGGLDQMATMEGVGSI